MIDEERTIITARVPLAWVTAIDVLAAKDKRWRSDIVRDAVSSLLAREEAGN